MNIIFMYVTTYGWYINLIVMDRTYIFWIYKISIVRERFKLFLWSALNMTVLSYILVYALYDLRNMKWGTR